MTLAEEREYRLKGEFFVDVHEDLGMDAQGVGDLDLALGWPFLKGLYAGRAVPLVCANLFDRASGEQVFPSFVVRERGGVKVAFVAVLAKDPGMALPREIDELVEVRDPIPELRRAMKELEAASPDLVVLLAHLGKDAELAVARDVPGIDVVIGGHSHEALRAPLDAAGVLVLKPGYRGKQVARLDLWLNPKGEPGSQEFRNWRAGGRTTLQDFPRRVTWAYRLEDVKKEMEEDPAIAARLESYKAMIQALPPLEEEAPAADMPAVVDRFWGSETCTKCHKAQAEWWRATSHSDAFATLEKIKMEKSGDCIGCHSVGYKDAGGFDEPALVGDLKNVGCESCHGKGDLHGQEGVFNTSPRAPATCTVCHTPERDADWNEAKIEAIACPSLAVAGVGASLPEGYMKSKKPPQKQSLLDPDHVKEMMESGHAPPETGDHAGHDH